MTNNNNLHITTLTDNVVYPRNLRAEHGLSLYIEEDGKKILFDTGLSELFSQNAITLDIDLSDVDFLVISHGHYDHTGGLAKFMSINSKAKIYINKEAFLEKYNNGRYVGIPLSTKIPPGRSIFPDFQLMWLTKHLAVLNYPLDKNSTLQDVPPKKFSVKNKGLYSEDNFADEQYLVFVNEDRAHLITGCSHRGILNITENAQKILGMPLSSITGGLHTQNMQEKELHKIVNSLNNYSLETLNLSHCTGIDAYSYIKHNFKGETRYNFTGNRVFL